MKVSIVGAGHVGATLGYVCVLEGLADELVLVNRTRSKADGHALDLQHTASLVRNPIRVGSGDVDDSAGSDVIVMTISVPIDLQRPDRTALADGNAKLFKQWLPRLCERSPNALFVVVTNPVDAMTWLTLELTGLPEGRVMGVGTLVDSARFRSMMSSELEIHADDIRAYIIGEHGNSQVAVISSVSVGGETLTEFKQRAGELAKLTVDSGFDVLRAKGYTNFAVARAAAMVLESIRYDQKRTMPLSVSVNGYLGIDDVCLSIPVVCGRDGITRRLQPELTAEEAQAFQASAKAVREVTERISSILNDA